MAIVEFKVWKLLKVLNYIVYPREITSKQFALISAVIRK